MNQQVSKYLAIQCGKLRVERLFLQYSKQRWAVLLWKSLIKIQMKVLHKHVLRRLGFEMNFTIKKHIQMHTQ